MKDASVRCGLCSKERAFGTKTQCRRKRSIPGGPGEPGRRTRAWWAAAVHPDCHPGSGPAAYLLQVQPRAAHLLLPWRPLACFLAELGLMWVGAPGVWYSTTLSPPHALGLSIHLLCPHLCPWHGRCRDRNPWKAGLGLAFCFDKRRKRTFKVQGRPLQFIPMVTSTV